MFVVVFCVCVFVAMLLGCVLRSGSAHCDLAPAVEVQQCPLRSATCSNLLARRCEEEQEEEEEERRALITWQVGDKLSP